MDSTHLRGLERERTLSREMYFSDGYFSMQQLCSLSHQINLIHSLRPKNVIEIGIGNGFTSSFLRRAGYSVTTADINPQLEPDICASLDQVGEHMNGEKFDLVVCCEVLEHMPWSDFESNMNHLRSLGDRLLLTLPNYYASFGFGGLLKLPKMASKPFRLTIDIPRKKNLEKEHFWEVGSSPETSLKSITLELKKRYGTVNVKKLELNPYHFAFTCM